MKIGSQSDSSQWFISEYATESEIVQTAFKCILTSAEHNTREHFLYGRTSVFGPHINISKLLQLVRTDGSLDHRL